MKAAHLRLRLGVCASLVLAASVTFAVAARDSATPALGSLDFPITGSTECQRLFRQGMLEMHSFQYDQAHASFGAALKADSGCAMAAWGDAMACEHPIWNQRDATRAQTALARITSEHEKALAPKERAFIAAAHALFESTDAKAGLAAWLLTAARMHAEFPRDDEVALQHALALISVHGYDKARQREQSEAGAIALDVLGRHPNHPGAAHYVIHAFDNPEHAILALPAARRYAEIAPAASHALHMPSHTFTHLGMWREVVASNERSYPASQAEARVLGLPTEKWDWHSYSWLVAAHLELGQRASARRLVDDARALLARDDSPGLRNGYSDLASNFLTHTGRWAETEALVAPLLAPIRGEALDGNGPVACAEHAPGGGGEERRPWALLARLYAQGMRAEAALHSSDAAAAEARAEDMVKVTEQMAPWAKTGRPRWQTVTAAYVAEIKARAALLRARTAETESAAIAAITHSVELTETAPIAGPAFERTPRERLADALLAAGKPVEALTEYERVLDARPNRALSMLGAARAARAAGDPGQERAHYQALADLWKDADPDLPVLAEVREGAGTRRAAVR